MPDAQNSPTASARQSALRPSLNVAAAGTKWLDSVAVALLTATVILSPLPLASVIPGARAALAVAGGLAFAFAASGVLLSGPVQRQVKPLRLLGWCATGMLIVAAWILVQALPAPFESWVHPAWRLASLSDQARAAISPDPAATISALLDLLAIAGLAGAPVLIAHRPETARILFAAFVLSATAYAVYGLLAYSAGNTTLLWIERFAYLDVVTGPFVNRNAFASYLGLAAAAAVLLTLSGMVLPAPGERPAGRLAVALSSAFEHGWLWIACLPILVITVVLTGSRMGTALAALGMVLAAALYLRNARGASAGGLIASGTALIICGAAIVLAAGTTLSERVAQQGADSPDRPLIYELTVEAIAAAPILGHGYGTYEDSFRAYSQTPEILRGSVNFAHNTYLELAFELGMPAALILLACVAAFALRSWRGMGERRRHRMFPVFGATASAMVGLHSLVDFPVQVPAVAACLAILGGACVAQSYATPDARNR